MAWPLAEAFLCEHPQGTARYAFRLISRIIMAKSTILALGTSAIDKETTENLLALSSGHLGEWFR